MHPKQRSQYMALASFFLNPHQFKLNKSKLHSLVVACACPGRAVMQIRTLKWRGLSMWPPEWTISAQGLGEAGVLEEVHLRNDLNPKLISLVANHLGDIRQGIMALEDPALLKVVYGKLKQHVGRPLTEIGDLEISHLPPMPKRVPRQVRPPLPGLLQVDETNR
jgi:hypothetical protein